MVEGGGEARWGPLGISEASAGSRLPKKADRKTKSRERNLISPSSFLLNLQELWDHVLVSCKEWCKGREDPDWRWGGLLDGCGARAKQGQDPCSLRSSKGNLDITN